TVAVRWTFYEDPAHPTGHPEWVGYDVLRRSLSDCGDFVRVNAEPFARTPGQTESFAYSEVPPATGTTFQYRVVLVDASRQQLAIIPACDLCAPNAWVSCPELSAPIAQGTLRDQGWALFIQPCAGCYQSFYISGSRVDELRPYAVAGTVLKFYGRTTCGTVEGCALDLDHYEIAPCGPTPVALRTWGRVKAIYR